MTMTSATEMQMEIPTVTSVTQEVVDTARITIKYKQNKHLATRTTRTAIVILALLLISKAAITRTVMQETK